MPVGLLGVDSLASVTEAAVTAATGVVKTPPAFWGRYFTFANDPDPGQYQKATEKTVLSNHNIHVLPYARQTGHVGGTAAAGTLDGTKNAEAFFASFELALLQGQGNDFYMFLDVEPSTPLSMDYYTAWASALASRSTTLSNGTVSLSPCVYLNPSDQTTCSKLNAAVAAGAACKGVMVARYFLPSVANYPGPFPWNPQFFSGKVPLTPPVIAWQYVGDFKNVDAVQIDPAIASGDFLSHLCQPR
jgi:hypothetical protein